MMQRSPVLSTDLEAWRRNQAQPWNHLRYLLVAANLARSIGDQPPLHVLDLGGGDGRDALPLAARGHRVVMIDAAPAMLDEAARSAAAAGLREHIHTQVGDVADAPLLVPPGSFDLVLCHNVLQYVEAPARVLGAVAQRLRPGGWFSLLAPNPAAEALRLAIQLHDLPAALVSLKATSHHNHFYNVDVTLHDRAAWWGLLGAAGLEPVDYFGVRCVNDYLGDDATKFSAEGFPHLLALEQAMGARSPYRDIAHFWQIIARTQG